MMNLISFVNKKEFEKASKYREVLKETRCHYALGKIKEEAGGGYLCLPSFNIVKCNAVINYVGEESEMKRNPIMSLFGGGSIYNLYVCDHIKSVIGEENERRSIEAAHSAGVYVTPISFGEAADRKTKLIINYEKGKISKKELILEFLLLNVKEKREREKFKQLTFGLLEKGDLILSEDLEKRVLSELNIK